MEKEKLAEVIRLYKRMTARDGSCYYGYMDTTRLVKEKMIFSLSDKLLQSLGKEAVPFHETVFWSAISKDFYPCNEAATGPGLIVSGDFLSRGSFGYDGVETLLRAIFAKTSFQMETMVNLLDVYEPCSVEEDIPGVLEQFFAQGNTLPDNEAQAVYEISSSRSPVQFWQEVLPQEVVDAAKKGFFDSTEELDRLDYIRDAFVAYSDDSRFPTSMLICWNREIPVFCKWLEKKRVDEEDMFAVEAFKACLDSLQDETKVSDNLFTSFYSSYGDTWFWFFVFNDGDTTSYNGCFPDTGSLNPSFFLTPLILDACMVYMDEKYHWKEEKCDIW